MTKDEMTGLQPLDLIRHKSNGDAFIVHGVRHEAIIDHARNVAIGMHVRVIGIRMIEATNPDEWDIVAPDGSVISS